MKLTGKCKIEFENWILNNKSNHDSARMIKIFNQKDLFVSYLGIGETFLNALIIEFFDSVGIKILIDTLHFQNWFFYKIKNNINIIEDIIVYNSRIKATNKAIIKANEIYNSK